VGVKDIEKKVKKLEVAFGIQYENLLMQDGHIERFNIREGGYVFIYAIEMQAEMGILGCLPPNFESKLEAIKRWAQIDDSEMGKYPGLANVISNARVALSTTPLPIGELRKIARSLAGEYADRLEAKGWLYAISDERARLDAKKAKIATE
jgi:hypothetical protein